MDSTMNPNDVYVGMPVQSFIDFNAAPSAAIVVGVGNGGVVALWVMRPEHLAPLVVESAYHRNDERAQWAVEQGDETISLWDFTPSLQQVSDARTAAEEAGKEAAKSIAALSQARRKLAETSA